MSLPLLLGRTLLVYRFITSNYKEEGQQLKFPFLPVLETLKSEAIAVERAFRFVYMNAYKRLKI
jgi:hypothetical protein